MSSLTVPGNRSGYTDRQYDDAHGHPLQLLLLPATADWRCLGGRAATREQDTDQHEVERTLEDSEYRARFFECKRVLDG